MIPQINILSVVDVIGALSTGTLRHSLFIVDNHPANCKPPLDAHPLGSRQSQTICSSGQGSQSLITHVTYGQVLNWQVASIDLQTDVQIKKITFFRNGEEITAKDTPCVLLGRYGAPSGEYWAGAVNVPTKIEAGDYQYKIEFSLTGKSMITEEFSVISVSN